MTGRRGRLPLRCGCSEARAPGRPEGWLQGEAKPENRGTPGRACRRQGCPRLWYLLRPRQGKGLVSDSVILVPVLINFEGLGASLNARERSRADVYFPLFPFKDNFIKSLCFHSGLNMGHLNGKVIISPRLLMEREESGKGGMPARGRGGRFGGYM